MSTTVSSNQNTIPNNTSTTDASNASNTNSSVSFEDIKKILTNPTDLDTPIDLYQYDTTPQIVNIATGENETPYEQTDSDLVVPETETILEEKETEIDTEQDRKDITIYDSPPNDNDNVNQLPNELPTEQDTVDVPEKPDNSYMETKNQLYKRNPYSSTFVFFIPASFMILIVMGFRGMISFPTMLTCMAGGAAGWFVISYIINLSNKNTDGHFNEDGSINQGASSAPFFNIVSKVLGAISDDGGLING